MTDSSSLFLTVAAILLVAILILRLRSLKSINAANSANLDLTRKITDLSEKLTLAENEKNALAKYRAIVDADKKAKELLNNAIQEADEIKATSEENKKEAEGKVLEIIEAARSRSETIIKYATDHKTQLETSATNIIAGAKETSDNIVKEAHEQKKEIDRLARESREKAKIIYDEAVVEAGRIVGAANRRAEEIAGEAFEAKNNAELYENTAKAMKNMIDGYGDQYLVPVHSLLDDLAEDFGFTEAGKELKKARDLSSGMVKNGTAAKCDYVEQNRRETAVNFVVDAFNGKVDSILSRVKNDNMGKLAQEVKDAFTLVNFNGKAFRNAMVTAEYLNARLEELKWAAVAQQLKIDEREEQRRIKEQIREEEKARKEFEKAIRDSAKEEDVLRKAMEKAQEQIEKATEEQKAKYEEKLRELTDRLKLAEEKNQRAISMAQQTKRGHVYIISNVGSLGENVFKIGLTRRLEPVDRVRELGDASVPFEFDIHGMIFSEDAPALEYQLHKKFVLNQLNKANYRKEFFRVEIKNIREAVESLGINAKWTMSALAREYKESCAIDAAIKDNPEKQKAWVNKQLKLEPFDFQMTEEIEAQA